MKFPWVWRLRTHLSALLLATMVLTFSVVSLAIMVWRAPEIERRSQVELEDKVIDVTAMLELLLNVRLGRMRTIAGLLDDLPPERFAALLDASMGHERMFNTVSLLSAQGRVEAASVPAALRAQRADYIGDDLSANALFRAVQSGSHSVWSGKYMSALSGEVSVGLGYRVQGGRVLIGELSVRSLMQTLGESAGKDASAIWVVDRNGEILADTDRGRHVGKLNILNWPLMQALLRGETAPTEIGFEGRRFHVAVAHVSTPDWLLIGHVPVGLAHPETRRLSWYLVGLLGGCLLMGLLIAPLWAARMARPLQKIVERAALTTAGHTEGRPWPRGSVVEFNRLARDLESMAASLQDRERWFRAIFNAAPVPLGLVDDGDDDRVLDVNEAWCREFMRRREDVVGLSTAKIGLWTPEQRKAVMAQARDGQLDSEAVMLRGNGQPMQVQVLARRLSLPGQQLTMWAMVDTGPIHRVENELRDLNLQLEERVDRRTRDLASVNEALSETVAQLRQAQDELVRGERMAALGSLVAGVAHELNTPLGNGVMAVSAMADAARSFTLAMQGGLKRADLQRLVDSVAQGVDIAGRNLQRAAELVQSFKQVAVDQTSAQRRGFEVYEIVHEMVISLRPSYSRTPYRIAVDVPESGLWLDSYPGALGQVIGNLIQNAMLHGFDGRAHGTVRIHAGRAEDGSVLLSVSDDGRGIASEHLGRVFDPFMTTKMGKGGSGLGLPISYNAVVNLLGGTLTVRSVEGQGACFEMRLPAEAPNHPSEQAADGVSSGEELWL